MEGVREGEVEKPLNETILRTLQPLNPIFLFSAPRFTLALKFAASKEEALAKLTDLDIEPILEYQIKADAEEEETIQQHLKEIKSGKLSKLEIEKIIREYEKKLKDL